MRSFPILVMLAAWPALAQPAPLNPRARELFEQEPVLMHWALGRFDSNRDGWISMFEAQGAVTAFREIADTDGDERVTVREFEAAKAFLASRYALAD